MTDWHAVATDLLAELDQVIRQVDQLDQYEVRQAAIADTTICVESWEVSDLLDNLAEKLRHRIWLAELEDSSRISVEAS